MKKNTMMRLASALLVLVLLTTCAISGTFAKYTTSATSNDKARVAYWGFQAANSMNLTGLFAETYGTTVDSVNGDDVIAPGTTGTTTFAFAWDEDTTAWEGAAVAVTGPEVAYNFTVAVESVCDQAIAANPNIVWALDAESDADYGSFADMINDIKALSGDPSGTKQYAPNTLPAGFTEEDDTHTITWKWLYETAGDGMAAQDVTDTTMGNAQLLDDVSIKITITATQVD